MAVKQGNILNIQIDFAVRNFTNHLAFSEWTGELCEADVNECNFTSTPCQRGECVNTDGGFFCNCTGTGYEGKLNRKQVMCF